MVNHNTISDEMNLEQQGSILRGILGSLIGMFVCILVMLLCGLFRITKTFMMRQKRMLEIHCRQLKATPIF